MVSERTRLDSPGWMFGSRGTFVLDLSWDDTTHRWLEVQPDPDVEHGWRMLLCEADDDSSAAAFETIECGVRDVTALLIKVEADPWLYDRRPA
jgi:hypothetical protein